nr:uncharacterized protein LOC123479511 [Desmodus rotundus]
MQVTFCQTPEPWARPWAPPAPSSSILLFCRALGFTTYPAQRWLCCYPCSFAKPCHPVPTECQDDEACGIGIGTSEQGETIQRKGCLPRALCSLPGHATYWSHSHVLQPGPVECGRHAAATPQPPPHLPAPHGRLYLGRQPPLPASLRCAAFDPGLLHITVARKTPAQTLLRYSQEPDFVQRPQTPGLTPLQTPSRHDSYGYCSSPCSHLPRAPPYQKHLFCVFRLFWVTVTDALS